MGIKKVTDFNSPEYKYGLQIYKSSFPSNETRPVKKIEEMLWGEEKENYSMFICPARNPVRKRNPVVGMSLMYVFRSLRIGLLDYMAVRPTYQRKGYGKEIFNGTFKELQTDVHDGIGLLMEIQREDTPNLQKREINVRKNRIRFYVNIGAKVLERVNYLLPPIQHGIEPEEMYLMIKPLNEIQHLTKESVLQYIKAIYSTIYKYHNEELLDKISRDLPSRIMLKDMVM
jgi:GNAT superfamily N-acetyltransferase